jgi:hypothetical protein
LAQRPARREDVGAVWSLSNGLRAACAAAIACLAGCSRSAPPAVFEMAEVVPAGTAGAIALPSYDLAAPMVHVVDATVFHVARAVPYAQTMVGDPGIGFELEAAEHAAFRAWTRARIGRSVALLVDRRVASVAVIMSELPGSGVIDFRRRMPPDAVEEIARRLGAQR